ncbi:NfeD family protein [Limibaculum sp. FT325]|uniref:NfeD family protein n=1 Tax=Thermohalobaculum sediminis TaxID=2939436 RepID=UPI0020C0BE98|nr:NfeD family protein [Limibaculum sediminis]MCL5777814.1 NfeD family protein [Limibaculum sediminis]
MPQVDLFAFLDGASAWWWVALALALGAVEVVTFTYFLLWLSLGALTVAGLLFVVPDATGTTQVLVFAVATLVIAMAGWGWLRLRQRADSAPGTGLNRRAAQLVGRTAVVSGPFRAGVGMVEIDGVSWRARLAPDAGHASEPAPGSLMRVLAAEGATLLVDASA